MFTLVKRYWAEILALGFITVVVLIDLSPGITWINTDSDGAHYILAAKYFTTAHNTSAPLYLILGHYVLELPFGTEAWRMGLMSAIPTVFSSLFIYLIVRELIKDNSRKRLYGIIASLVYGTSALVISQSTIIETYSLVTMCGLGAYYCALRKYWTRTSIMLGIGIPIHPLIVMTWIVLFIAHKDMRNWRRYIITLSFGLFYLYIPIVGYLGHETMWGNTNIGGFISSLVGVVVMLCGGISMWDIPKRIIDTVLILIVCFGVGIIPLGYYVIKERKLSNPLLWLIAIPIVYFMANLAAETYVYLIIAIAYGSIAVGLGLSKMNQKFVIPVLVLVLALGVFNANYFDIGRTLDPEMSAEKFYNEELSKIPDGEIFMGGGWTWAMVYLYNKEEDRNIIPVSTDLFPSEEYRAILDDMGIKYKAVDEGSYITREGEMALSVASLNDNVWIAKETKPEVYQYTIEPAIGNEEYIGRWIGQEINPEWQWKPSNPYSYITGALEVKEWHHILMSTINANVVVSLAVYSLALYWLALKAWDKRGKKYEILRKA